MQLRHRVSGLGSWGHFLVSCPQHFTAEQGGAVLHVLRGRGVREACAEVVCPHSHRGAYLLVGTGVEEHPLIKIALFQDAGFIRSVEAFPMGGEKGRARDSKATPILLIRLKRAGREDLKKLRCDIAGLGASGAGASGKNLLIE